MKIGESTICENQFLIKENQSKLVIAIEIFLAETSLMSLRGYSNEEIQKEKRFINQQKERFDAEHGRERENELSVFDFFTFVKWLQLQMVTTAFTLECSALFVLEQLHAVGKLKSFVAKSLLKQFWKLNADFSSKQTNVASIFSVSNEQQSYEKLLNAFAIQHKELYLLEQERLANHNEYADYEEYFLFLESIYYPFQMNCVLVQ